MVEWTESQLRDYYARHAKDYHANRKVSHPIAKPHEASTLDANAKRKEEGLECVTIRIVGHRVRPLDPDNFAGSTKDLIDGLRRCGLIDGDEWWRIKLETEQVKVHSYDQEKTIIQITYP